MWVDDKTVVEEDQLVGSGAIFLLFGLNARSLASAWVRSLSRGEERDKSKRGAGLTSMRVQLQYI